MIELFLGLILLFSPFLLLLRFKEHFSYIFLGWVSFQAVVSILMQHFGSFSYIYVIIIFSILFLSILLVIRNRSNFKIFSRNWVFGAVLIVFLCSLFSLHTSYSGPVGTIAGNSIVEKKEYMMPYFSDEWNLALLVDYVIEENTLPNINPLNQVSLLNFLMVFHSIVSLWVMLLGISVVTQFAFLPLIISGLLACVLYVFLRSFQASRIAASLSVLFLLYLTNGANIPGIWFAMPFIFALGPLLLSIKSCNDKNFSLFLWSSGATVVIYPPFLVFITPLLLLWFFGENRKIFLQKKNLVPITLSLVCVITIFLLGSDKGVAETLHVIKDLVVRDNLLNGIVVKFPIQYILPFPVLLLSFLGCMYAWKRKLFSLLTVCLVGSIFWIWYQYTNLVFIIESPRVVYTTGFLLVLLSGIGLGYVEEFFSKHFSKKINRYAYISISICIISLSLYTLATYPGHNPWDKLVGKKISLETRDEIVFHPAPPINRYFHEDDERIFSTISNARFIAPPWKGLVIAATTNNIPLHSKPSFFDVREYDFVTFMNDSCGKKKNVAASKRIEYVYGVEFFCPGFKKINTSSEGLILYRFEG